MDKIRQIDRRLLTILLIVFVQMLGAAMILPILPLYAKDEFNMTPQIITLLNTAFFGAQFLAGPYLGRLSDKYGRVPVLIGAGQALTFKIEVVGVSETATQQHGGCGADCSSGGCACGDSGCC